MSFVARNPEAIRSLVRALAALACTRTAAETPSETVLAGFTRAVERMEDADLAYRSTLERLLPHRKARAVIAAMDDFRAAVSSIRERTRIATGYDAFDPLDTYVPALPVSHAHAVRAANAADLARTQVAEMRAEANVQIGALLERVEIEHLLEAKRVRNAGFDRALRDALPSGTSDRLATQLVLLADTWY